jgi:hypothetical protein
VNAVDDVIAVPAVPEIVWLEGVIDAAGVILITTVAVTEPEVDPVAVMVNVAPEVAVGVPEITPVEVLKESPVGMEPAVTA